MDEEALKAIEERASAARLVIADALIGSNRAVPADVADSALDVPALIAEVRRLRAVEADVREMFDADAACADAGRVAQANSSGYHLSKAEHFYQLRKQAEARIRSALSREVPR